MNAEELLKKLIEYGADAQGIHDRFMGDAELYESCFLGFMEEASLDRLGQAIDAQDYKLAFDAAHSIKGVAGNLGLIPYYTAICTLVESLRAGRYETVEQEYAAAEQEYQRLQQVCSVRQLENDIVTSQASAPASQQASAVLHQQELDPVFLPQQTPVPQNEDIQEDKKSKKEKSTRNRFIVISLISILGIFIIALVGSLFLRTNYREKMENESGQHLIETGTQIGIYLENRISNDWGILRSTAASLAMSNYSQNDDALLRILQQQQNAWDIADFMLYTENGDCVNAKGTAEQNGIASDTIVEAMSNGSAFLIIDSQIVYTIPIESEQTYGGSKIVALSLVRNMDAFLDEMDFTSFQNKAWIYLTDESGIVISMYTGSNAPFTFNAKTIFDGKNISKINANDPAADLFETALPTAYYMFNSPDDMYVVSVPISAYGTGNIQMRLFYMVPKNVVNDALNNFSGQLTIFSLISIGLLMGLAALLFYAMYRNRKQQFDIVLSKRDQMFDLLIQNTRIVFGLFSTSKAKPVFISGNSSNVLGEQYWTVWKDRGRYWIYTASGNETKMLQQVNERIADWKGLIPFKSGYLCDDSTVPPSYFEMTLFPVGDFGEDFVGIIQDMTAAHDREEATKSAMEMAKRSDEAKTRFLANMSHDIRTPMNAIVNMSQFALESTDEPEKHREYLKTIYESSEHLLHLINDVLDMSRIESGQVNIASEPFNLQDELERLVESIKPLSVAKGQTLAVDFVGIHAQAVVGDSLKVSQIMTNLLSNAIKFTPQGGTVRFTAEKLPSLREDMVSIRFTVSDTGIGISEENKRTIFEPFSRVNDNRVRKIEGTGLGLSICKSFADAMGGTIRCDSTEGVGSTFTVELFFHKTAASAQTSAAERVQEAASFSGMRCLVVEDIAVNQLIAKKLLGGLGFTVELASDGGEGVQKFLQSQPGTFDVIYMDIRMPVIDGYQAAKKIRQSAHPQAKSIPILAMSANVFAEDIEKARVAGMDGYVGKPVTLHELTENTKKVLRKKEGIIR